MTDACIKSFTKMNSSEDKYKHFSAKPSNECKEWQAQDKYGQKAKECMALAKRSRITSKHHNNCPAWILKRCNKCGWGGPLFLICYPICIVAYGCDFHFS